MAAAIASKLLPLPEAITPSFKGAVDGVFFSPRAGEISAVGSEEVVVTESDAEADDIEQHRRGTAGKVQAAALFTSYRYLQRSVRE